MSLRLLQLRDEDGTRCVVASDAVGVGRRVSGITSTYELAQLVIANRIALAAAVDGRLYGDAIDVAEAQAQGRLLAPIDHPDPAHLLLSGTGLTHVGSAESRDKMHQAAASGTMTDSMRMFRMGIEGGKPQAGQVGVQPEWFYKGDGSNLFASGTSLPSPAFALDGSEEPEIAGIYVIDAEGQPRRIGYCLGNDFSDHVTERGNYLWLAHSKLRPAAIGPELLLGPLPTQIRGISRIIRDEKILWEKPFLTGESPHVAFPGESRAPPLQICAVPPSGRCPRTFLRYVDLVLRGRHSDAPRRCVRDRSAALQATIAQSTRYRPGLSH